MSRDLPNVYQLLDQPEVQELPFAEGWHQWDMAVKLQDAAPTDKEQEFTK